MRRRSLPWAAVLALLLALLVPASAWAWRPLDACRPTWSQQPSRYHVNENGYSRIPLAQVREVFLRGMTRWSEPCCSRWQAQEAGLTTGVGEDGRNPQHIFSFRETSWPDSLGDPGSVLAVTLTRWGRDRTGGCTGLTADMVFNAVRNVWGLNARQGVIDLEAVTVHEAGHWLGLDHTTVRGATMQPTYFGEGGRNLHPDDQDGVCALYNTTCGCTTTADCTSPEQCIDGLCRIPPCTANSDCASGLECNTATGQCIVPPCRSDDDCPGSQICRDGTCAIDADCTICAACSSAEDCGGTQFVCAAAPGQPSGFCTRFCTGGADCPGNSACFAVPGENFSVCLNSNINQGICPASYVCTTTNAPPTNLCDNVNCGAGQRCDPATGRCVADGAGGGGAGCLVCQVCVQDSECGPGGSCVSFDGQRGVCTVACSASQPCPGTNLGCFTVQAQGGGTSSVCLNATAQTAGACPQGFVCQSSTPPPADRCAGVVCNRGESCDPATGLCAGGGAGTPDAGTPGDPDSPSGCTICQSCQTAASCGAGYQCLNLGAGNVCVLPCTEGCPDSTACFPINDGAGGRVELCLNDTAATDGVCADAWTCAPRAGGGVDSGTDGTGSDGVTEGAGSEDGCDCRAGSRPADSPWAPWVLLAIASGLVYRRRRR
jgi:MYXO-CTERM domain-containing protein